MIGFELDNSPVFMDIIEIFMAQGILFTCDEHPIKSILSEECINLLEKHIDFFSLLCLQDHKLINTNQYLIACSIASAARKHQQINPIWS